MKSVEEIFQQFSAVISVKRLTFPKISKQYQSSATVYSRKMTNTVEVAV